MHYLKWLECSLFLLWLRLLWSPSCQWTHFGIRSLQFSSLIPEFSHCLGKKIWGLTASLTCCVHWHNLSKRKRRLFVFPLSVGLFRTVFPWMLRVTQLCCSCFSTVKLFMCTLWKPWVWEQSPIWLRLKWALFFFPSPPSHSGKLDRNWGNSPGKAVLWCSEYSRTVESPCLWSGNTDLDIDVRPTHAKPRAAVLALLRPFLSTFFILLQLSRN